MSVVAQDAVPTLINEPVEDSVEANSKDAYECPFASKYGSKRGFHSGYLVLKFICASIAVFIFSLIFWGTKYLIFENKKKKGFFRRK